MKERTTIITNTVRFATVWPKSTPSRLTAIKRQISIIRYTVIKELVQDQEFKQSVNLFSNRKAYKLMLHRPT